MNRRELLQILGGTAVLVMSDGIVGVGPAGAADPNKRPTIRY